MKFKSYKANSEFIQACDQRSAKRIHDAFNPRSYFAKVVNAEGKTSEVKKYAINYDERTWLEDALRVFAVKADLEFSQAVNAFTHGGFAPLQRIFERRYQKHLAWYSKLNAAEQTAYDEQNPKGDPSKKLALMDTSDFVEAMRTAWVFALQVRSPNDKFRASLASLRTVETETKLATVEVTAAVAA